MTTTRIDHAAEARKSLAWLSRAGESAIREQGPLSVATAQVHATLALVEQQRIANLIALAAIEFDIGDGGKTHIVQGVVDIRQTDGGLLDVKIDPEIAAALGVER